MSAVANGRCEVPQMSRATTQTASAVDESTTHNRDKLCARATRSVSQNPTEQQNKMKNARNLSEANDVRGAA